MPDPSAICANPKCRCRFERRRADQEFCCRRCMQRNRCLRSYYRDKVGWKARRKRYFANGGLEKARIAKKRRESADPVTARRKRQIYYLSNPERWKNHKMVRRAREKTSPDEMARILAFMRSVRKRRSHRCHWCSKSFRGSPHFDHVIALSKGGRHALDNICVSCGPCNFSKSAKKPSGFVVAGQAFLDL